MSTRAHRPQNRMRGVSAALAVILGFLFSGCDSDSSEFERIAMPVRFAQLRDTARQHAPRGCMRGRRKKDDEDQRHRHADVQQHGCCCRRPETVPGIQNAAQVRDHRDAEQIGKGDPRQLGGQRHLRRIIGKARRQQRDDPGHGDKGNRQQHRLDQHLPAQHRPRERLGLCRIRRPQSGIHRHEGGVVGPLGEDRPEMVRQPKSHEKGVGQQARRQHRGHDHVPDEAGDAAEQREAAGRQKGAIHGGEAESRFNGRTMARNGWDFLLQAAGWLRPIGRNRR